MRQRQQLLERLLALGHVSNGVQASGSFSTLPSTSVSLAPAAATTAGTQSSGAHTRRAAAWNGVIAAGSFAMVGVSYCEREHKEHSGQSGQSETNPYSLEGVVPSTSFPKTIVIYQYEVCPFCCKVKAFLDYNDIPYRVVEVDPLGKSELKWSEYKKVPVVLLDDTKQVNNSSSIISQLSVDLESSKATNRSSWFANKSKASEADRQKSEKQETWRKWVDEKLVKAITVNIYRNARESFQTFDYITDHGNFGWAQKNAARVVGATMMWGLSNKLKKKYGIEGDVREALYSLANDWVRAMDGRPFMGGDRPSLADVEAFGVIRSIVGMDTFNDLQHNSDIGPWWARMLEEVGGSSRVGEE